MSARAKVVGTKEMGFMLWGVFGLGLVLHLVAAWNSVGFHHADEYSQVIEFAGYKLGLLSGSQLAWEFEARIRPFLQPGLHVVIAKLAQAVGVSSVMTQTTLARMFMAVLGWFSVVTLLWAAKPQWKTQRAWRVAVLTSMLFWFHPWFHARTSSEGLGTACMLFAIAALLRYRPWVAGFFLGLAFQARYLLAIQFFAFLGMIFWGAMGWAGPGKKRWAFLARGIGGAWVATFLGVLIDRWGYGEWVFPAWRYVLVNGLEGRAQAYGVTPWWDYIPLMLLKMPPVLGAFAYTVIITFWIAFWGRRPGSRRWEPHWLIWMMIPYVFVHMLVAHKESRFLYPVASFLPLMLAFWVDRTGAQWDRLRVAQPRWDVLRKAGLGVLWTINLLYLSYGVLANEHNPMRYQMEIADRFPQGLTLYSQSESDVFGMGRRWWGMPPNYHFVGELKDAEFARVAAQGHKDAPVWFHSERLVPHEGIRSALQTHCSLEYAVVPLWATRLNIGGWVERSRIWSLWRCDH